LKITRRKICQQTIASSKAHFLETKNESIDMPIRYQLFAAIKQRKEPLDKCAKISPANFIQGGLDFRLSRLSW
ncbi:MAG: hypothetical protein WB689_26890, partial [Xanthobacteraceae bacterium]